MFKINSLRYYLTEIDYDLDLLFPYDFMTISITLNAQYEVDIKQLFTFNISIINDDVGTKIFDIQ